MPDPQGLDVHDVLVSSVPSFDSNGRPVSSIVVTYSVGPHGPFPLVYSGPRPTPEQVNADIDKHVAEIRAIVMRPGM